MRNKIHKVLIIIFTLLLLSCNKTSNNDKLQETNAAAANDQNISKPQEIVIAPRINVDRSNNLEIINRTKSFEIAYVEAPELKNVMPNSWQRLSRLTEESEKIFLNENIALIDNIIKESRFIGDSQVKNNAHHKRVYEERVGSEVFYRVIMTETSNPPFDEWGHHFLQGLIYEGNTRNLLITTGDYNGYSGGQFYVTRTFVSIDIIRFGNNVKGILETRLEAPFDGNALEGYYFVPVSELGTYDSVPLEEPAGTTCARYYLMNDISEEASSINPQFLLYMQDCFVDSSSPLRYALQSAFDGNPDTCLIANTKNALFSISLEKYYDNYRRYRPMIDIKGFAVINGYAQNRELYFNYNRVKKIKGTSETELTDGILGFQLFNIQLDNSYINFTDIYRGEKYNFTCIAELNIKIDQIGWLFGDIDE